VADYATEFRGGLGEATKDALSGREIPGTLNLLISQAIALDERARERKRERALQQQGPPKPPPPPPPSQYRPVPVVTGPPGPTGEEPMQLGRARTDRITPSERAHRRREGLCMFCASSAHTIAFCPAASSRAYHQGGPPKD